MKRLLALFILFFVMASTAAVAAGDNNLQLQTSGPGTVFILLENSAGETSNLQCSGSCDIAFAGGDTITLMPRPSTGAKFLSWDGRCTRSEGDCTLRVDPGISGENIELRAAFEYLNNKNPFLRKNKKLSSRKLSVTAGCGGTEHCNLEVSGFIRGSKRVALEPIYFDLAAKERRSINLLAGSDNADVRKAVALAGKKNKRARIFVRLTDVITGKSSAMAINEKPRCCWDKKPSKPQK